MPLKVLLAQNSAFIANRLPRAARSLQHAGYEVDILNWDRGVNRGVIQQATQKFAKERISVHSIYCGHTPYGKGIKTLFNKLLFIIKVIRFLNRNGQQYDVVHAIDFDLALPVYLAKKMNKKLSFKCIYDIADFVETFHSPIPKVIRKMISKVSHAIMAESDAVLIPDENRFINIPQQYVNKTFVINNTIDPPVLRETTVIDKVDDRLNVFYYGALSPDRGIDLLLELENVEVWFAGKGELHDKINEYARIHEHIHYLGYFELDEVLFIANQMDLIYMVYDPSYQHNQIASPNKLFEALYLGKPCIVAEGTSIDKFVEKHQIGYVTSYNKGELQEIINQIETSQLKNKGEKALALYPQFSWDKTKAALLQIYEDLLKGEQK